MNEWQGNRKETEPMNRPAVFSLVVAILSLVCCVFWYASLLFGVSAIVLGIFGLRSPNPRQEDAAIAGIIVGAAGVLLGCAVAGALIFLTSTAA